MGLWTFGSALLTVQDTIRRGQQLLDGLALSGHQTPANDKTRDIDSDERAYSVEHLERCWSILERLHTAGLYLGDAKLANFLAADDGKVWVLDFETAGVIGDKPSPIRTFNIKPGLADVYAWDLAHF